MKTKNENLYSAFCTYDVVAVFVGFIMLCDKAGNIKASKAKSKMPVLKSVLKTLLYCICLGTLDENTRQCPHALKMVACQLLLEITAFLRESHSSLARKAENQRMRNKSIAFSRQNRRTTQKISVFGAENRDAVTSGPAERLRQGNPSMLSPVMNLLVPTVQIQQTGSEKKISAPVIKVEGGPSENENEEASKPARKRFSALFSNSEKKRKLLKPDTTERKASTAGSRIYKKSTKCKYCHIGGL